MTFNKIKWQLLKTPIALLIISIALSVLMIISAYYYQNEMDAQLANAQNALQEAERRYDESQSSLKIISEYLPEFRLLQDNHFLNGEERLMSWINDLQTLRETLKYPSLSYSFAQPKPHPMPNIDLEKNFNVYVSKVELSMSLWHGGDLFKLLDRLSESHIAGLFTVDNCTLKRMQDVDKISSWRKNPSQTNLEVACTLEWYTARIQSNDKKS